jgi:hypothetical protein
LVILMCFSIPLCLYLFRLSHWCWLLDGILISVTLVRLKKVGGLLLLILLVMNELLSYILSMLVVGFEYGMARFRDLKRFFSSASYTLGQWWLEAMCLFHGCAINLNYSADLEYYV